MMTMMTPTLTMIVINDDDRGIKTTTHRPHPLTGGGGIRFDRGIHSRQGILIRQ